MKIGIAVLTLALLGCGDREASSDGPRSEMVEVSAQVFSAADAPLRIDTLLAGKAMKLAAGEYVMIAHTRYQAREGGGELTLVKGQIQARNVDVKPPN